MTNFVRWYVAFATTIVSPIGALGQSDGRPASARLNIPRYSTYYHLQLRVDPLRHTLEGDARIATMHAQGGTPIILFAAPSLTIDSVRVANRAASFEHHGDTLLVPVRAIAVSKSAELRVFYHADSVHVGIAFDAHAGNPAASTYGLPYSARTWWPCPGSTHAKADSADVVITVPMGFTAVSNGHLVGRESAGGWTTYHWSTHHPIYPDVMSLAIADYAQWSNSAMSNGRRVPLQYYVFREDSAKAATDFRRLPAILSFFSDRFGPYPFADDKYGVAEFATQSFREHQTIPSLGPRYITGDGRNEWILAHELAHQWFGNSLSVRRWSDVWLNEGLATYAALLWLEHADGRAAYDAEIAHHAGHTFDGTIAIHDTADVDAMFTGTTFYKSALMLHALRRRLGDERFFTALKDYTESNRYGLVDAADFQRRMDRACGHSLDAFFVQWLTQSGAIPSLEPSGAATCPVN